MLRFAIRGKPRGTLLAGLWTRPTGLGEGNWSRLSAKRAEGAEVSLYVGVIVKAMLLAPRARGGSGHHSKRSRTLRGRGIGLCKGFADRTAVAPAPPRAPWIFRGIPYKGHRLPSPGRGIRPLDGRATDFDKCKILGLPSRPLPVRLQQESTDTANGRGELKRGETAPSLHARVMGLLWAEMMDCPESSAVFRR
jgi:hypothetical protein